MMLFEILRFQYPEGSLPPSDAGRTSFHWDREAKFQYPEGSLPPSDAGRHQAWKYPSALAGTCQGNRRIAWHVTQGNRSLICLRCLWKTCRFSVSREGSGRQNIVVIIQERHHGLSQMDHGNCTDPPSETNRMLLSLEPSIDGTPGKALSELSQISGRSTGNGTSETNQSVDNVPSGKTPGPSTAIPSCRSGNSSFPPRIVSVVAETDGN